MQSYGTSVRTYTSAIYFSLHTYIVLILILFNKFNAIANGKSHIEGDKRKYLWSRDFSCIHNMHTYPFICDHLAACLKLC